MSTLFQNAELLKLNLTNLIRIYDDDAVTDATMLATRVLALVKSEMDRANHKFSTELFITAILHVVFTDQEPSLQRVLDCIVDPKWETEKKMLIGITRISNQTVRRKNVQAWLKVFNDTSSSLSEGVAQRTVMRCHAQWCKAFNLPILATSINNAPISKIKPMPLNPKEPALESIRIGTRYELSDATALATKIMSRVKGETDETIYTYAHELFIAVALMTAHTVRNAGLSDVLECIVDPSWDSTQQIYSYIGQCPELTNSKQAKTRFWITEWMKRMLTIPNNASQSIIMRSHTLWQKACLPKSPVADNTAAKVAQLNIPPNTIQVFNMASVAKAMTMVSDMRDEKRSSGDRLLKNVQENDGYRTIPDVKKAGLLLKKAKGQFENLAAPINRLMLDLTLCASMDPKKFRVTPILLLGDPGIGKTFLAMALANGLGGSMEKISAGGAQGGFQLTGSHSSFNSAKHGQVFKALAEGKTTSPVFVIDEVDKIGAEDRYPILPVLLDLFEPDTARCFKDEFYEMEFDASRIIYILTANSLDNVPEALRSRVEIFDIPRPEPAQRLRIIQAEAKQLREATGKNIKLDKSTMQQLSGLTEIDLRKTARIVKEAFAKAIIEKSNIAKLVMPDDNFSANKSAKAPYHRSEIGFL